MRRAIALLLALVTSGTAGLGFANLVRSSAAITTPEQLAAPHEAEEQLALAAGLTRLDQGSTDAFPFEREIPLTRGQCVAAILSLSGPDHFEHVRLSLEGGRSTENDFLSGSRVEHLAICARDDTTATLFVQTPMGASSYAPRSLRFTLLRGELTEPRTYARLDVDEEERALVNRDAVLERLAATPSRALSASVHVPRTEATVLPASASTFAALRALTGRRSTVPALDATLAAEDPYRDPNDRVIPPRVFAQRGPMRAIAAIDTGALAATHGVGCVSILLARLDDPATPVPITRIDPLTRAEVVVPQPDPAIARDEICAHGLFVYVTDEASGGELVVSIREGLGQATTPPVASRFGLDRRGAPLAPLVPLTVASIELARQACDASDASACGRWASFAAEGLEGAGEPREPLARQCELAGGDACDRLATVYTRAGELRAADDAERRACETRSEWACLRRAARFRDAGRFGEAFAAYRLGCDHGSSVCCSAVATMQEWQLTSG